MFSDQDVEIAKEALRKAYSQEVDKIFFPPAFENIYSVEDLADRVLKDKVLINRFIYWFGAEGVFQDKKIPIVEKDFSDYYYGEKRTPECKFLERVFKSLAKEIKEVNLNDYL